MNTITDTPEKTILLRVAENLVKAQQELDELAVQLALGKAEAKDKFEELKKSFRAKVNELKQFVASDPHKELSPDLKSKIEELEALLNLGKAEDKNSFEEQKQKILDAIENVEEEIKTKFKSIKVPDDFFNEFEKFKLKMEILRLKFVLKKFEIKDGFRSGMGKARSEINKIASDLKRTKSKYNDLRDEIHLAYDHFRKAVKSL